MFSKSTLMGIFSHQTIYRHYNKQGFMYNINHNTETNFKFCREEKNQIIAYTAPKLLLFSPGNTLTVDDYFILPLFKNQSYPFNNVFVVIVPFQPQVPHWPPH